MEIEFCIDRDELRSALAYVAPFIKTRTKKGL